jgi:flagellar motility protein MotE (MotC chaperone)
MKPALKYTLMAGGGLVLLFGSFVTFAALSGQPLHKNAVLKLFVPPPVAPREGSPRTAESETPAAQPATSSQGEKPLAKEDVKAVERTIGVLGAFALPSPFSTDELTDLQQQLGRGNKDLKARLAKIEQRERELDDRERDVEQRQLELTELRQKLGEKESELRMLSDEVTRDSEARNARDAASWKELSKFFEDGEPADLAKKLLSFDRREAAKILRSLDDERASAIVNALPADKYHDYLDAYRAETAKDGAKKKP